MNRIKEVLEEKGIKQTWLAEKIGSCNYTLNKSFTFKLKIQPLAYKLNSVTEYLMVYRKQTDKLLDWNIKQYDHSIVNESKVKDGFETTNVWQICPKSDKIHSAIFPVDLCKRVIDIARDSKVFVANTLSRQNKNQCDQLDICWVACRDEKGFRRFTSYI